MRSLHKSVSAHAAVHNHFNRERYAPVGEALQAMFAERLGERWTPEASVAWAHCYRLISDTMIAHAYGELD